MPDETSDAKPIDRWTPRRKVEVLQLIEQGRITEAAACALHAISPEELDEWRMKFGRGLLGQSKAANQPISLADQIRCVRREITRRELGYPKRVAERKMMQEQADRELAAMRAVYETLEMVAGAKPSR